MNDIRVNTPKKPLNCKTKNVVYLAQCSLCGIGLDNSYNGQTQQQMHKRINGHRSCFVKDNEESVEKSALALHARDEHPDNFDLDIFKFMILDSVNPCELNRRESRAIGGLRTNVMGLNRMKVQK